MKYITTAHVFSNNVSGSVEVELTELMGMLKLTDGDSKEVMF